MKIKDIKYILYHVYTNKKYKISEKDFKVKIIIKD